MRTAVIALSLTTAAFAASTVYLARELKAERASATLTAPAAATATTPAPAPAPALASAKVGSPPVVARSAEPAAHLSATVVSSSVPTMSATVINAPPVPPEILAKMNAQRQGHYRDLVQRFDDPEQRAEMVAEFKAMTRNSNKGLGQALKLSKPDAEKLEDLLALEQAEYQVRYARCSLDGPCDHAKLDQFGPDTAAGEIANLLGADGQQKILEYRTSLGERNAVTQFRSRLSDANYLREETAESLVAVLVDERKKITAEASKNGNGLSGIGNGDGMVWVIDGGNSPEARYASAQENSRRFRARAAEVLTPSQLRAFEEMQDELLLSTRQQLRQTPDPTVMSLTTN